MYMYAILLLTLAKAFMMAAPIPILLYTLRHILFLSIISTPGGFFSLIPTRTMANTLSLAPVTLFKLLVSCTVESQEATAIN